MLLWLLYVLAAPIALLPVTIAGGWFIKYSAVVEDWRETWALRQADAIARFNRAAGRGSSVHAPWPPLEWVMWWTDPGRRFRSWPALASLKMYGALLCGVCFGWHVGWGILAAQGLVAWRFDGPALVGWAEALPVWGALVGYHTVAFQWLEEREWFS
jgi:hypothetical protein